jgi:hypothetical protein
MSLVEEVLRIFKNDPELIKCLKNTGNLLKVMEQLEEEKIRRLKQNDIYYFILV